MVSADDLTPWQCAILRALTLSQNGRNTSQGIALLMGYDGAKKHRVAVTRSLRRMLNAGTDTGLLVLRVPGQDNREGATWCIRPAGQRALMEVENAAPQG
jgi:hypothetical protein